MLSRVGLGILLLLLSEDRRGQKATIDGGDATAMRLLAGCVVPAAGVTPRQDLCAPITVDV